MAETESFNAETEKKPRSLAELAAIIEALVFVAEEPLAAKTIAEILAEDRAIIESVLENWAEETNARECGLQ